MGYETVFIALLISLIFITISGYYPGGIIVPGYLILFLSQPERLAATLAVSILTWISYWFISKHFLLFGRRRFTLILLIGACWTLMWFEFLPIFAPLSPEFRAIGWIIPGLIANQFEKQGPIITCAAMAVVMVLSFITIKVLGALLPTVL